MPRILTYNVHRCLGMDGKLSPARIAEVIASCEADIVALQELDVGRMRTGRIDQAQAIAEILGMDLHFHPAVKVLEELYGDAILTPHPSRLVRAGALPGLRWAPFLEPRGALWAEVQVGGHAMQVINTHLGLGGAERRQQVAALLGPDWLGHPDCRDPTLLVGDFNAGPRSVSYRLLASRLDDAQNRVPGRRLMTFPARVPLRAIDHVFVSPSVEVVRVEAVRTPLARVASDHVPFVAAFRIAPAAALRQAKRARKGLTSRGEPAT